MISKKINDDLPLQTQTNKLLIEMPLVVNTYDIDVVGHVNNIVCFRWLEDLRNKLFSQIHPLEKLLEANHYPVVISCDVKYKKQIKLFDKLVGRIFLENHIHGIFTLKAEILKDNYVAFTAIQKCVLMNLNTNKIYYGNISDLVKHHSDFITKIS